MTAAGPDDRHPPRTGRARSGEPGESREAFAEEVRRKAERRRRAGHHRSILGWIGVFGMVGWTVAVPALAGAALGRWIDGSRADRVSWTITFLLVGLAVGAAIAWFWVARESSGDD